MCGWGAGLRAGVCLTLLRTFRLKPLDVAFMKAIHNKVNIVPVIAKADTLTLKERERLKKRVSVSGPFLVVAPVQAPCS